MSVFKLISAAFGNAKLAMICDEFMLKILCKGNFMKISCH